MKEFLNDWGLILVTFLPLVGVAVMLCVPKESEGTHKLLALLTSLGAALVGAVVLAQLAREVLADRWGEAEADRVGLRLSPVFAASGIDDPDPGPVHRAIATAASDLGLAYLHLADTGTMMPGAEPRMDEVLDLMRGAFDGPVVLNGGYDAARARHEIATGDASAVAFGRAFLANPDLPRRLAEGLPLNPPDPGTFYGGDHSGYTDYPLWTED